MENNNNLNSSMDKIWNYVPVKTEGELFDRIVIHLLTQNEKSESEQGCRYFYIDELTDPDNPKMLQCAVGPLVNIKYYNEDSDENLSIEEIQIRDLVERSNPELTFTSEIYNMLQWFQYIHDNVSTKDWYFACYLLWRDMNFLVNYNKKLTESSNFHSLFKQTNTEQMKMYAIVASLLGNIKMKNDLHQDFLEAIKNGATPTEFFNQNPLYTTFLKIQKEQIYS